MIEMDESGVQDYDKNYMCNIYFNDETSFPFILRNSSNGYYDGYLFEKIMHDVNTPINTNYNLIILVGLPGCGKSTFAKNLQSETPESICYDDADISQDTIINKIKTDIQNKTVIVAHTRFCLLDTYYDFINRINLSNKEVIITYCFLPDVSKSIQNVTIREKDNVIRKNRLIADINRYKHYYPMDDMNTNYEFNCKILETYSL